MTTILTIIHIANCVLLIVVVLLQSSKGGGLAGAFGGGAATNAVFGGRGAGTFLSKMTAALAIIFMITSLSLTVLGRRATTQASVLQRALQSEGQERIPQAGLPQPQVQEEEPDVAAPEAPPAQPDAQPEGGQ